MTCIDFPEANKVLRRPDGWTEAECYDIQSWVGQNAEGKPVVISCWTPTPAEWDAMRASGKIWLHVHGNTMPPCYVGGENPFRSPDDVPQTDSTSDVPTPPLHSEDSVGELVEVCIDCGRSKGIH